MLHTLTSWVKCLPQTSCFSGSTSFFREKAICADITDLTLRNSFSNLFLYLSIWYDVMIYLLTATGLTPGGSRTVHIYKQTIHRTTQVNNKNNTINNPNGKSAGRAGIRLTSSVPVVISLCKIHNYDHLKF
jgi:hypothetical protein